ncbi:MAG: VOC family protein [Pseudomonadota bacterium]
MSGGTTPGYLRLRQICLVARDAQRAEQLLTEVLGLAVAFRDERTAPYGLENMIFPLGTSFLEVVVPTREGTAAGRFLDRYKERRGYMLICDCSDLDAARQRIERLGIRILHSRKWPRYENLQLHPGDTGGTMIEIHHNIGGDALDGHYEPAGDDWRSHRRDEVAVALLGAELTAPDPEALANRWSALFGVPHASPESGFEMMLGDGKLRFLPGSGGEQLHALTISVRNVDAVLSAAVRLGCPIDRNSVELCGMWFRLHAA